MRGLVTFALIALAWVALNLVFAGINFIGDNYADIISPIIILGGLTAALIWAFKKGN